MPEPLRFVCSHCGKQLSAKPQHAGKSTRCPGCQKPVTVPLPEPAVSPAENFKEDDILQLLGRSNSSGDPNESAIESVTKPVQSEATSSSLSSTDVVAEKQPVVAQIAKPPRQMIVAGALVLAAVIGLAVWYFTKPSGMAQVTAESEVNKPAKVQVDQAAGNEAPDGQESPVSAPRSESIDLLKGDFDEVTTTYFKQKFPDSTNVEATLKLCLNVEAFVKDAGSAMEELKKFPEGSVEWKVQAERLVGNNTYLTKNLARDDPFLLREAFKLSACRAVVAQSRFEQSKKTSNLAKTAEELKARTDTTKSDEAKMIIVRASNRAIGKRMAVENLDTVEIERTAGLK